MSACSIPGNAPLPWRADPIAVARLAEQPPRQGGSFLQQFVEDAAQILGGGPVATVERITEPGLARELFDEGAADPRGAFNEVALRGGVDVDALAVEERAAAVGRPRHRR